MLNWQCKAFSDLSPEELYQILSLRVSVFMLEQNCLYPELDQKDQSSYHLMGWLTENQNSEGTPPKLVAYARLLPPGVSYDEASIGRVATSSEARRFGYGRELMAQALQHTERLFMNNSLLNNSNHFAIRIGAQRYLKKFYESFGFVPIGKEYMEDGILHIEMLYNAKALIQQN